MTFLNFLQYENLQSRSVVPRLRNAVLVGLTLSMSGVQVATATQNGSTTDAQARLEIAAADNVEDTVTAISNSLKQRRFTIELVVNHMAAANSVGLDLRPTQVIYAQPPESIEAKIREDSASAFIDLPLKFLVFEDENGEVQVRHNSIGYLIERHGLPTKYWPLQFIDRFNALLDPPDNGLVSITSRLPVNEAYAAIKAAVVGTGAFRIPLELTFGTGSARQKLLVFGNPNVGTPLMQQDQNIGLDLPQEILVGGDGRGGSIITYNDPFYIAARHGIIGEDQRLAMIRTALGNFAGAGSPN